MLERLPTSYQTPAPDRPRQPAVLAWLRLARVCHKLQRAEADWLRHHNLSPAQFDVLAHVWAAGGQTQQQLADSLLVTKGNVCQLLDRMEESDLITRRQDGRAKRLYLTDRGRSLIGGVLPDHEARIAQQLRALAPDEQTHLLNLLRKLDHALDPERG